MNIKKLKCTIAALLMTVPMILSSCTPSTPPETHPEETAEPSVSEDADDTDDTDDTDETDETEGDDAEETTDTSGADDGEPEESAADEGGSQSDDAESGIVNPDYPANDIRAYLPSDLQITPAMWKVTDPASGNSLYMLGTFHIAMESQYPLPDYIEDVYNNCDGVAVEYDIRELSAGDNMNMDAVMAIQEAIIYTDGSTVADHVSPETYEMLTEFWKLLEVQNPLYDYFTASYWNTVISSYQITQVQSISAENGVDSYFINKAAGDGKSVISIETIETEAMLYSVYTDELADYLISEALSSENTPEFTASMVAQLYIAWATGDLDAIEELNEEAISDKGVSEQIVADYEESERFVLDERNKKMAERASEFLTNGDNYFFMVGAAHYIGDKGILALLTDMGYTVERVG